MLCGVTVAVATPSAGALAAAELAARGLVAKCFRALGDPTRLDLLVFLLARGEATGAQCVERAGLSQGRVSAHLAYLVSCGLAVVRREGRFAIYQVADPRVAELLSLGTGLSADHAETIAACLAVGR